MMSVRSVIIVLLLFCFGSVNAQESKPFYDSDKSRLIIDFGYMYNDQSERLNISLNALNYTHDQKFSYTIPFIPTSLVKRNSDDIWRYSFAGPVIATKLTLLYAVQKIFYPDDTMSFMLAPRWFDYLVLSPNSGIKQKLTPDFSLGVSMHTDYFFVRTSSLDRGILFTPALDFTYYFYGNKPDNGALVLSATYSSFLNFEGDNNNDGLGFKISYYNNGLFY